jgi:hypothetical protein
MAIIKGLQEPPYSYVLKDVGVPERYLGARISRSTDCGVETWEMSAQAYLGKALPVIEERFGSLKTMFSKSKLDAPAPSDYHPEIDQSDFFIEGDRQMYQSCIGIMRWAMELARVGLAHTCATMAKFMVAPRIGHLTAVIRTFAYVKNHLQSKIVFDPTLRNWNDIAWLDTENLSDFY